MPARAALMNRSVFADQLILVAGASLLDPCSDAWGSPGLGS
jgi:hypothetical protein